MRPTARDVVWSVCCLCVCLFVGRNSEHCEPYKTNEAIEIPFGIWTRVGPTNHALGGGPDSRQEKGQFGGCSPIEVH